MTQTHSFPVVVTIPVQWGDMDALESQTVDVGVLQARRLGHVNNTRYLAWFESARIAFFQRVGVATEGSGVGPILATTTCDFLVPVVWPATVTVGIRVSKVGETSVTNEYEIRDASAPEKLYAKGSSVIVMFDYRSSKKVRVSDEVRGAIERLSS